MTALHGGYVLDVSCHIKCIVVGDFWSRDDGRRYLHSEIIGASYCKNDDIQ
jgi:hypothetical protein